MKPIAAILIALMSAIAMQAVSLPSTSQPPLPGYEPSTLRSRLKAAPLHRIEGIWQLTDGGATIAIERTSATEASYRMVMIDGPNRGVPCGTVIGMIEPSGSPDLFKASIYTTIVAEHLTLPRGFTLRLNDSDSRIEFLKNKSKFAINLWHFVPYLWRYSVTQYRNDPRAFSGCIRIYPNPAIPSSPVYL